MIRLKKHFLLFIINHFLTGTHAFKLKRAILNCIPGVDIGLGTKIVGPIRIDGFLSVGQNTWIGHDFCVEGNGNVLIGDRCDIAPCVMCFTGSHKIGEHERRAGEGVSGSIQIGDGCWIGASSKILLNKKIGAGSVVAAGAVITKDVEEDSLAGGIPASTIRKL